MITGEEGDGRLFPGEGEGLRPVYGISLTPDGQRHRRDDTVSIQEYRCNVRCADICSYPFRVRAMVGNKEEAKENYQSFLGLTGNHSGMPQMPQGSTLPSVSVVNLLANSLVSLLVNFG